MKCLYHGSGWAVSEELTRDKKMSPPGRPEVSGGIYTPLRFLMIIYAMTAAAMMTMPTASARV